MPAEGADRRCDGESGPRDHRSEEPLRPLWLGRLAVLPIELFDRRGLGLVLERAELFDGLSRVDAEEARVRRQVAADK